MLKFEHFRFDATTGQLTGPDGQVYLRQKLVQLLDYLLTHNDRAISKEELLGELWQHGAYRERSLAQSILELRKALGDSASDPRFIRTVPGKGYQWICQVEKPETVEQAHTPTPLRSGKYRYGLIASALLLICALALYAVTGTQTQSPPQTQSLATSLEQTTGLRVMVIPFDDQTYSSAMQWIEYGLSDMLAGDLAAIPGISVVNPANASVLISAQSPSAPTTPRAWAALLQQHQIDRAITATVRLSGKSQLFEYQIIDPLGDSERGTLQRDDLAVAMPEIASSLHQILWPDQDAIELPPYGYTPSAMHDYARGIQALQLEGALLAQHYFAASVQIDPGHLWSLTYLGICQLLLGDWERAEQQLSHVLAQASEPQLLNFSKIWLAMLRVRQGDTSQANVLLATTEDAKTPQLAAARLQIQALIAARHQNWPLVDTLRQQASTLAPASNGPLLPGLAELSEPGQPSPRQPSAAGTQAVDNLRVLGQKPALLSVLLTQAQQPTLSLPQRQQRLEQASTLTQQLGQPYEQIITMIIRARQAHELGQHQAAQTTLKAAYVLATELKATSLLTVIERSQHVADEG